MFQTSASRKPFAMQPLIRQLSNARSRYFLTSSGLNLEYRQKGDPFAETIVMVHGTATDCRIFLPNIDRLAETYQVIAVSLRGHGLSDKPRELTEKEFSMDILVRDLIELTWSLGIQAFHLVGHGLGAYLGYELLSRDPGSLLSITSMAAPAGPEGLKSTIKILQKATGITNRLLGNHKKTAESAAKLCSSNQEVVAFLKDEVFYATDWQVAALLKPLHQGEDYVDVIRETPQVPVMLFRCEDPQVEKSLGLNAPLQSTIHHLEGFGHVRVTSIAQSGYFPNLDQPQTFQEELMQFLGASVDK